MEPKNFFFAKKVFPKIQVENRKRMVKRFMLGGGVFLFSLVLLAVLSLDVFRGSGRTPPFIHRSAFGKKDRIVLLLVGLDEEFEVSRTDTLMVASLGLKDNKISVLSIPRDTRVEMPNGRMDKINHAYPKGGILTTRQVVEKFLDVPVDYYVLVRLEGFRTLVNMLGGVPVDVEKRMRYVDKAGHLNINLYPGLQTLDGENAMGYVRFRHDNEGDFGRIRRQQKFLKAALRKTLTLQNLPKIPVLVKTAAKHLETDLSVSKLLELSRKVRKLDMKKISFAALPGQDTYIKGVSYLLTDEKSLYLMAHALRTGQSFDNVPVKVEILNGSGVMGAGRELAKRLYKKGFEVEKISDADRADYENTTIVLHRKNNRLRKLFLEEFPQALLQKGIQEDSEKSSLDATIIVGRNLF